MILKKVYLSPYATYTLGSSHWFLGVPQKEVLNLLLLIFLTKVRGLIGSTKTQFKNLKFGMEVNWPNYFFVVVDMQIFSELKKGV